MSRLEQPKFWLKTDEGFLKTVPAVCMLLEIVLGLVVWALVAATPYKREPPLGFVVCVAITFWILTIFMFIIYIAELYRHMVQKRWLLLGLLFNACAVCFYFAAAVVEAMQSSRIAREQGDQQGIYIAAAVIAFVVTCCYCINLGFSFRAWRSA
ncbi:CKLF-like MARVEL transmembrane domain-containing protein 8 [Petromyzon marinus]|uniref:CKLF-like MARVEL transmembrane domain-containing protein 8 n=1 Tax=Petromyzon marinus TaxID=7757 RepID=A0AAJ7XAH0_PETMA|nr:CKLF-like MARVEL transmembrane domain-containing protein 8 [Petromyzon marinus]